MAAPAERQEFRATDYLTGDEFAVRPTADGWWETQPAPTEMNRYYPPIYYGGGGRRFPGWVEGLQSLLYRWRARGLTRAVGKAGRVLDVGCGPGHLLARFRERGWSTTGTEATPTAAASPRERYGLDVRVGELREIQFAAGSFDLVVSWHTLEHMRNPGEALDEMVRVLRPGGHLLVSVPDFYSREASAGPAAWFHLDVPRHLTHFPAETLRAQIRQRGLVIAWESFLTPEYDVFSLVQTWQNRFGLPHNLLYLMMKSASPPGGGLSRVAYRLTAVGATMLAEQLRGLSEFAKQGLRQLGETPT